MIGIRTELLIQKVLHVQLHFYITWPLGHVSYCHHFSLGTPDSSTTKTGRHDIAEILLKVALKYQKSSKSKNKIYV
jgi:hypothetical protein